MAMAIRLHETGGPDVLRVEDVDPGTPGEGEVQVRHTVIGVNYSDVYDRTGLYPLTLPATLGREAAGVIVALGRRSSGFRVGERVAYVGNGTYCAMRNVPAAQLVKLPRDIADDTAAAIMLKGLTAQYLLRRTYRVKRGEWILLHAAAGGVGLIVSQWARALGAKVIGVVGTEAKAALAKKNGCRHTLLAGRDPLVANVKRLTKGQGVSVAYDSVGKDTFMESLDCLRPLGMMVSFGNASGPPPAIAPLELTKRGSLFLTRPTLFSYISTRAALDSAARELFAVVRSKAVRVHIGQRYPLAAAAQAHRDLESRITTGSTVLVP